MTGAATGTTEVLAHGVRRQPPVAAASSRTITRRLGRMRQIRTTKLG
jgi:hypothetical protein